MDQIDHDPEDYKREDAGYGVEFEAGAEDVVRAFLADVVMLVSAARTTAEKLAFLSIREATVLFAVG